MTIKKCFLCGRSIEGYGNNPAPLPGYMCCDECNQNLVLPIKMFFMGLIDGALIVTPSGTVMTRKPRGEKFTLEELQHMVDGFITIYPKKNNEFKHVKIFVGMDGLLKELKINKLARNMTDGLVNAVGNVVFVSNSLLGGRLMSMFDKPADAKVGDLIEIVEMLGEPRYTGKRGVVSHIDSIGQLYGTWGSLAIGQMDIIKIIARAGSDVLEPDREPKRTPRPRGAKPKNKEEN